MSLTRGSVQLPDIYDDQGLLGPGSGHCFGHPHALLHIVSRPLHLHRVVLTKLSCSMIRGDGVPHIEDLSLKIPVASVRIRGRTNEEGIWGAGERAGDEHHESIYLHGNLTHLSTHTNPSNLRRPQSNTDGLYSCPCLLHGARAARICRTAPTPRTSPLPSSPSAELSFITREWDPSSVKTSTTQAPVWISIRSGDLIR